MAVFIFINTYFIEKGTQSAVRKPL